MFGEAGARYSEKNAEEWYKWQHERNWHLPENASTAYMMKWRRDSHLEDEC